MIDNSGTLTPKWPWLIDRGTEQVWKDGELAAGRLAGRARSRRPVWLSGIMLIDCV